MIRPGSHSLEMLEQRDVGFGLSVPALILLSTTPLFPEPQFTLL